MRGSRYFVSIGGIGFYSGKVVVVSSVFSCVHIALEPKFIYIASLSTEPVSDVNDLV